MIQEEEEEGKEEEQRGEGDGDKEHGGRGAGPGQNGIDTRPRLFLGISFLSETHEHLKSSQLKET